MALQQLINKQDNFEIIRDGIAQLLANEIENQKQMATAASLDPVDWDAGIYTERSNPWEQFLNDIEDTVIPRPIVNVWYDGINFDGRASNISDRQKGTGTFNIDCYAAGIASDEPTGHIAGDEHAAREVHRVTRLIRNIIMASENVNLGFQPGLIWKRWVSNITPFQPQLTSNAVQQVVAARIALQVDFNEESPQYTGEPLCDLGITLHRAEDGLIIAQADYDYT